MRRWGSVFAMAVVLFAGCTQRPVEIRGRASLTSAEVAEVDRDVREFMGAMEHDVSAEGPTAWRRYFADSDAFFMASEGQMVFSNSAAATSGILDLKKAIRKIELHWGPNVRVDPLATDMAVVAASYKEVRIENSGKRIEEAGFFTGVAERSEGRWELRDAHWSVLPERAKN